MDVVANVTLDIVLDYCVVANSNITLNDNLILEPDLYKHDRLHERNPGAIIYPGIT